jgi:prepilin-type N-terminal cleavage/methylation domain-containing protein
VKRSGYTLFEMAIVLALLVLLAGLAVPSLETMYSDYKLQSAVDQVRGKWAALRARAIVDGRPYRFSVVPGAGDFRGAPDSGDFSAGGEAADPDNGPLVFQDSLPQGITFGTGDAPAAPADDASAGAAPVSSGGWTTAAVFLPDGTAQQDAQIVFSYPGSGSIVLRLRALTGGVSTRRPGQ